MSYWLQFRNGGHLHLAKRHNWETTACGINVVGRSFSRVVTSDLPLCKRCTSSEEYALKQASEERTQMALQE